MSGDAGTSQITVARPWRIRGPAFAGPSRHGSRYPRHLSWQFLRSSDTSLRRRSATRTKLQKGVRWLRPVGRALVNIAIVPRGSGQDPVWMFPLTYALHLAEK